jgi:two-component system, cell cycle response regulator DivK
MSDTLLIIEDNAQNMYMMKFLLEKAGFSIAEAENGKKGIELARKLNPKAILLDIQLPDMDGYAVLNKLKQDTDLKIIPIVAVTSYAMAGDREKILDGGANGYIEKPIDPERFVESVKAFLDSEDAAKKSGGRERE